VTPVEAAIQAATNAGTASGFAQALEQVEANLSRTLDELATEFERLSKEGPVPNFEQMHATQDALVQVREQVRAQLLPSKAQSDQLQKLANATAAAALQSTPDMAKIRGAVAVLMGAG